MKGFVRDAAGAVLLCALCSPAMTSADEGLDMRVEAGFTFDDNVTRARLGPDKLSDRSFGVTVNKGFEFAHPDLPHARALVNASLAGESFQTYRGLSRIAAGLHGEIQYRPSAEFGAPTFAVFARASREEYDSVLRDGYRHSAGVSVRKSLTDRIDAFGALAYLRRDGRSTVFDAAEHSARMNLDYALSRDSTAYASAEYRRGDTVSTAPATLLAIDLAKAVVADDAFTDPQRFAYRIEGHGVLGTLGYNFAFGEGQAFDVSWRRARFSPSVTPEWVAPGTSIRYYATQFSATYLIQF